MTYYIIGMQPDSGKKYVIGTASNIAYARRKIAEHIEMDMHIMRYTNGYHITTEKVDKEYHGVRVTNDEPFTMRSAAGTKPRAEIRAAIEEYKAERERMLAKYQA